MTESRAVLAQRFVDYTNTAKLDALGDFLTDDFILHHPLHADPLKGADGFRTVTAPVRAAYPDFSLGVEEVVAEGDLVAVRWALHGTHQGVLMGIHATGVKVTVPGVFFMCYRGDKLAEMRIIADNLGMIRQLGVEPLSS